MRMSRRAGLLGNKKTYPTAAELFADMQTVDETQIAGRNDQSTGTVSISNAGLTGSYALIISNGWVQLSDMLTTHYIQNCYGGTIAIVYFPSYTNEQVMGAWNSFTTTSLSSRDKSSYNYISTNNKDHSIVICALKNTLDIRDGATYDKIGGTQYVAIMPYNNALTTYCFGGSIIGID